MPYCSKCGTQNSETAKFCVNCGAPLQTAAAEQIPVQPSSPTQPSGIGSKVSFAASDGKTYTGTIKEIQGDQYKIKYDAFDFETWLKRDQFTYLTGGSVNPPVYSAVPNTQVTFSSTAATSGAPGMFILVHLGFWGSIIILIGFFTNWINIDYTQGKSITGLTVFNELIDVPDALQNELTTAMLIAISVIIISAIVCLLYILGVKIGRGAFIFFKILPLLTIIGFIVYCVVKASEGGVHSDDVAPSAWKVLGIGIYLTLAGSLLLAISRSRK